MIIYVENFFTFGITLRFLIFNICYIKWLTGFHCGFVDQTWNIHGWHWNLFWCQWWASRTSIQYLIRHSRMLTMGINVISVNYFILLLKWQKNWSSIRWIKMGANLLSYNHYGNGLSMTIHTCITLFNRSIFFSASSNFFFICKLALLSLEILWRLLFSITRTLCIKF